MFVPTEEQTAFIDDPLLELVLTACPGSGKTHTAVLRFINRCKAEKGYGVALLSFTNTAVDEAYRIARENQAAGIVGHPNYIGTIDAFFQRYVFEPFIRTLVPNATIPVEIIDDRGHPEIATDPACLVRGVTPNLKGKSYGIPLEVWKIRSYVNLAGERVLDYDAGRPVGRTTIERTTKNLGEILKAKTHCIECGFATFYDILQWCRSILQRPELRASEIVAQRFREIMIDESQDTSMLHQVLFRKLASAGANISYIGDTMQGIYGFNFANASYLAELIKNGHINRKLSENFRSNKPIVDVVNSRFGAQMKHKRKKAHKDHGAFVFVGAESDAIRAFECLVERTNINPTSTACIARNKAHIGQSLRPSTTMRWRSTYRHAIQAWQSERLHDVDDALRSAVALMRIVIGNESLKQLDEERLKEHAWTFIRGGTYPEPRDDETPADWADRLKDALGSFLDKNGLKRHDSFPKRMAKNGIGTSGSAMEKLSIERSTLRTTVVHQVKGESITAVLVIAPDKQHESWLNDATTPEEREEHNICYVAFTRAGDLLVLQCPNEDVAKKWRTYGFRDMP